MDSFFRERQIKEIEASFEACKSRPVHATNKNLYPVEVLPLLPDFERYGTQALYVLILISTYFIVVETYGLNQE